MKLGDRIERGINRYIPRLAVMAHSRGCNCEKRKEFLNKLTERKNKK
ncbi:hypothetical protein [Tenacibaculum phage Larrie]|nr:hypothetical protein [Tenacibaculum phage Larrie]